MDCKISVIIPVHNVERFLRECLDSVLNQTIGSNQLQVIMIDDHSIDSSLSIMEEYSTKYPNFISISLPEGKTGAGVARNAGLDIACGKYVMFSDADDFYELNTCEIMFDAIEKSKTDFVTFNYRNVDEDGKKWDNPIFNPALYDNMKLRIDDYDKSFYVMNSSVCNKIFNRQFLLDNGIRFFEDDKPSEDTYFSLSSFLSSVDKNGACYVKDIVYNYI